MGKFLLFSDLAAAATRLRTDIPEIRAVSATESRNAGFDDKGRVIIRFEGHIFRKYTGGKFDKDFPTISHRYMVDCPYNTGVNGDYRRFAIAMGLDPEAAMKACSWGMFQIMGFHYATLGFKSVGAMVDAMKESEGRQLLLFCDFLIKMGLDDDLREHRFTDFAYRFNGAGFRGNPNTPDDDYDLILLKHFIRFGGKLRNTLTS